MTTTLSQDQPAPPGGFGIDPRLGAATLNVQAASREDSLPHIILKFHRLSSLDNRARQGLPVQCLYICLHLIAVCYNPCCYVSTWSVKTG